MDRTLRYLLLFIAFLLFPGNVFAQRDPNELRAWVRFEVTTGTNLRGPYRGVARFQIGRGSVRAMVRPHAELRILHGNKIEQAVPLPKLPSYFDWDTTPVQNDRYTLQLVLIDDRTQAETVMDEIQGKVDNATSEPVPVIESASSGKNSVTPAVIPSPRFLRRGFDGVVSGVLSVPVGEWPENVPARYLPVVDIYRDGKRVDSQGTGGHYPFVLNWDTTATPNGVYTLKMTVINLVDNSETSTDEMVITIHNLEKPAPPTVPVKPVNIDSSVLRGTLTSRNGIGILRGGTRTDQFKWVMMISKAFGDPFPQVAAAQWALESSWGKSTSGKNNYFGIKAAPDQPGTEHPTSEWGNDGIYETVDRFADYESPTDGIAARIKFLKKSRYSGYWTAGSADAAARALQRGGYATDPNYATQLISIMRRMGY